ncbi:plasma protease C1 inhibitor-like [Hemiscyllium ocellatum]|uniref:plasma protease C1 inhibitor-like n=1 Tax=Hemiscyllium ocellatum TaxID=170820 RepID=UPI0029664AFA|nr:plasma protease C1 inhibitor-like [Hemiscyllium ocellatum]
MPVLLRTHAQACAPVMCPRACARVLVCTRERLDPVCAHLCLSMCASVPVYLHLCILVPMFVSVPVSAVCSPELDVYVMPSRTDRQHIQGVWFPQGRCSQLSNPWQHCDQHKVPQHELQSLASSLTQFGLEAFHIIARYNRDANVLISPVSLAAALTHLLLGARNNSKHDLETALFYQPDVPCVHETLAKVLRQAPSLLSVSQLFYKKDLQLKQTFMEDSQRLYGIKPMSLSTNMSENVRNINSWITKHTGGKITTLVNHVTADTELLLLNAVFYKGTWKTRFRKEDRREEFFSVSPDKMVTVPMLHHASYPLAAIFHEGLNAKIAKFQMFGRSSLIVMVPGDISRTVQELEQELTLPNLRAALTQLQGTQLKPTSVLLPALQLRNSQDLIQPFNDMGLQDVLVQPNLCGMSAYPVEVSGAEHQAALTLDEEGVEAAAITALSVARNVVMFEVQQPYLVILWNDELGYPLFIGRVMDPSQ